MKAWRIWGYPDAEWSILIHAETEAKAKSIARGVWPDPDGFDWIYVKALRPPEVKQFDYLPFTGNNVAQLFTDEDGNKMHPADHINFCPCEICKGANHGQN